MLSPIILGFVVALTPQDTTGQLNRAAEMLASGQLPSARAIVNDYLRKDRNNYDALMLRGRIELEWPVIGRFDAWRSFREASRQRPEDPQPYYFQALVGERLGGADGERMIREGLLRVWERDPDYPFTWLLWQGVYHGVSQNLEAARVLQEHAGNPVADFRRARLLVEAGRYLSADSVIAQMITAGVGGASALALAAESFFMQGRASEGINAYGRALDDVSSDTLGYLWTQLEPIASPEEMAIHAGITSERVMTAFYNAFWEKREPDLTTEENERVGEHFRRLGEARRLYRIRHPQSRFHSSARWRRMARANLGLVGATANQFLIPGDRPLDGQRQAGVADPQWDAGVREPDSLSRYRRYGLDGRGLIYLRYGEPKTRLISAGAGVGGDVESWTYQIDGADRVLTFSRATGFAGFGGEMVLFPVRATEIHNSEIMLERDETAIHPDIRMSAWVAFFRNEAGDGAFVYVRSRPDRSVARVWDAGWRAIATARGTGPLSLAAAPGRNTIGIDFRDGDRLARIRQEITVPRFADGNLSVSSVIVAATDDGLLGRDELAGLMPAELIYEADSNITVYAEIYGLAENRNGNANFVVDYIFIPEGGGTPVLFSFQKTVPSSDMVEERLIVEPGRVHPGVYRVLFRIRDLVTEREAVQTRVDVRLR